jgi:cytochrome P450
MEPETLRAGFDIKDMNESPVLNGIFNWISEYPQREVLMGLLRNLCPVMRWGRWSAVCRNSHVREVLDHAPDFPVDWGDKMTLISGPAHKNFVLGMSDDREYRQSYRQLSSAFPRDDMQNFVAPMAAQLAQRIVERTNRLDAVRHLMWAVPAQLCEDYYGLHVPDKQLLAEWSIVLSGYLFGPAKNPSAKATQLALKAAAGLRQVILDSISATRAGHVVGKVLQRLLAAGLSDGEVVAHMLGMVTGFVPTNLLAAGNILETLLRNPSFMSQTRDAALSNDDDLLWRCLKEALRFRYINLGSFRGTTADGYTLAGQEKPLPGNGRVWVLTQSAMFDGRDVAHPRRFDPHRATEEYLTFGYGQHWCLGAHIAQAQITQTFKPLLRQPGLRRASGKAGRMHRIQTFPANLIVEYGS